MSRIKRRRRVRCKLPCEIVVSKSRRVPGRVITLSEGGLAVLTGIELDQGDPVRIVIDPKGVKPIQVSAIVWNDTRPETRQRASVLRRLGCIVSQPTDSFTSLLERMLPPEQAVEVRSVAKDHSETTPLPPAAPRDRVDEWNEPDLPRSRELQPPPKVEPEDSLPWFRVRLKQLGGPRTRILTLRARSATQAEELALEELAGLTHDASAWGVLHVARVNRR